MLTAVVLSHNSSSSLARTLGSVKFCDQLLVVDDFSSDDSQAIATSYGAKVLTHALNNDYAAHHNWAIAQASSSDWILLIHHDEVITPMLRSEIQVVTHQTDSKIAGYYLHRADIIWGHSFRYGDGMNASFMRLAKPGQGLWTGAIHEVWTITGPTAHLKSPLLHYPHHSLSDFLSAINSYSSIRATELLAQGTKPSLLQVIVWPPLKFIHNYILRLGFLDGIPGFIHAMTMAFYTFLVRGKVYLTPRHA